MAVPVKDVKIALDAPKTLLLLEKHSDFIMKYGRDKNDYEYVMAEFLRLNGVYWGLTAVDLMQQKDRMDRGDLLSFVRASAHPSGGFAPTEGHDPHILYTLSAVQIAATLDALDSLDKDSIVSYISGLQQPDGSFTGDKWGEVDTRFSFCALACLALLGVSTADAGVDIDKAVDFVASCRNFDGGFGSRPGSESHAGLIYCCVGFLSLAQRLDLVDADQLGWWLAERQLPSGGLNGRPEKLPDVCYGWWVLASLSILGRLRWIDVDRMADFIRAAQDVESGGISDRPGDWPDPFHTLFGLAGLSLLGCECGLKRVNPVFCMAQEVIDRLGISPQTLVL